MTAIQKKTQKQKMTGSGWVLRHTATERVTNLTSGCGKKEREKHINNHNDLYSLYHSRPSSA